MNKRGFIFTFISVILVSVIMLAFLIQYSSRTRVNIERINTDVETMNSFVKNLNNNYIPRAMEVSGNQAILSLLDYMDENDKYVGKTSEGEPEEGEPWNIEHVIINAMLDGEYKNGFGEGEEGPELALMEIDDVSYNLSSTLNEINLLANFTGINLNYEDVQKQKIKVFQDSPWHVNISIEMSYTIKNKDSSISWNYENIKIKTAIPISNFKDPLYFINADSEVIINRTTYELPSEINEHVADTNYAQCGKSPNFLNRTQGNFEDMENSGLSGIESLVDFQSPLYSVIDFQYLNTINPSPRTNIGGSGYLIDSTHDECYNI